MKKTLFILFIMSLVNFCYSQQLSKLQDFNGIGLFKFGDKPSRYRDIKKDRIQVEIPYISYTYTKDETFAIEDIKMRISSLMFLYDNKLQRINLISPKENSIDSLNHKFSKLQSYFENIYGKDWIKTNNENFIWKDSLHYTFFQWKWKDKKIILGKSYFKNNLKIYDCYISINFVDDKYPKGKKSHIDKNVKLSKIDSIGGYKQFIFGTSQTQYDSEIEASNLFNGSDTIYYYKNDLSDFEGIKVNNIALVFNSQKYNFPLYRISLTSDSFKEYNEADKEFEKLSKYYSDKYKNFKTFINKDQSPTYSRILKEIRFIGKNKLFSISMDYSEKFKYTLFIDFIDYEIQNDP